MNTGKTEARNIETYHAVVNDRPATKGYHPNRLYLYYRLIGHSTAGKRLKNTTPPARERSTP